MELKRLQIANNGGQAQGLPLPRAAGMQAAEKISNLSASLAKESSDDEDHEGINFDNQPPEFAAVADNDSAGKNVHEFFCVLLTSAVCVFCCTIGKSDAQMCVNVCNSDVEENTVCKGNFGGLKGLKKTLSNEVGSLIGKNKTSNESVEECKAPSTSAFDVQLRLANAKYAEEILKTRNFKYYNENCFDDFLSREQEYAGYFYGSFEVIPNMLNDFFRYFNFIYADPCWDVVDGSKMNSFMQSISTSINSFLCVGGNFFIHVPFENLFALKQVLVSPGFTLTVDEAPICLAQKQVSSRCAKFL